MKDKILPEKYQQNNRFRKAQFPYHHHMGQYKVTRFQ